MHPKAGPTGPWPNTTPEPDLICEGERVPCRDAKRRVWQALDLLRLQPNQPSQKPAGSTKKPQTHEQNRPTVLRQTGT